MIDEKGQPTKVYSWDYQRPFDKCWFRVFSAAFAWIDGQMAHVITSVDIDHQKKIEEELIVAKEKAEHLDRLKSAFLANRSFCKTQYVCERYRIGTFYMPKHC